MILIRSLMSLIVVMTFPEVSVDGVQILAHGSCCFPGSRLTAAWRAAPVGPGLSNCCRNPCSMLSPLETGKPTWTRDAGPLSPYGDTRSIPALRQQRRSRMMAYFMPRSWDNSLPHKKKPLDPGPPRSQRSLDSHSHLRPGPGLNSPTAQLYGETGPLAEQSTPAPPSAISATRWDFFMTACTGRTGYSSLPRYPASRMLPAATAVR